MDYEEPAAPPAYDSPVRSVSVPLPFINSPVGAGDIVKAATSAVGVKPCNACEQRRQRLNNWLRFIPRRKGN